MLYYTIQYNTILYYTILYLYSTIAKSPGDPCFRFNPFLIMHRGPLIYPKILQSLLLQLDCGTRPQESLESSSTCCAIFAKAALVAPRAQLAYT